MNFPYIGGNMGSTFALDPMDVWRAGMPAPFDPSPYTAQINEAIAGVAPGPLGPTAEARKMALAQAAMAAGAGMLSAPMGHLNLGLGRGMQQGLGMFQAAMGEAQRKEKEDWQAAVREAELRAEALQREKQDAALLHDQTMEAWKLQEERARETTAEIDERNAALAVGTELKPGSFAELSKLPTDQLMERVAEWKEQADWEQELRRSEQKLRMQESIKAQYEKEKKEKKVQEVWDTTYKMRWIDAYTSDGAKFSSRVVDEEGEASWVPNVAAAEKAFHDQHGPRWVTPGGDPWTPPANVDIDWMVSTLVSQAEDEEHAEEMVRAQVPDAATAEIVLQKFREQRGAEEPAPGSSQPVSREAGAVTPVKQSAVTPASPQRPWYQGAGPMGANPLEPIVGAAAPMVEGYTPPTEAWQLIPPVAGGRETLDMAGSLLRGTLDASPPVALPQLPPGMLQGLSRIVQELGPGAALETLLSMMPNLSDAEARGVLQTLTGAGG